MSDQDKAFRTWGILEVMGHRKLAGLISEVTIAGAGFIRVDVPEHDGNAAFTSIYGPSSIYGIQPLAEEIARAYAASLRAEPITEWQHAGLVRALRGLEALPTPFERDDEDDEDAEDDDPDDHL